MMLLPGVALRSLLLPRLPPAIVCIPFGDVATATRRYCPNLCLYSMDVMKALTISASTKLPLN